MLSFRIIPSDRETPPMDIMAHDASGIFYLVERMNCRDADVERNGAYAFSVRLDDNGMWCISQRATAHNAKMNPNPGQYAGGGQVLAPVQSA